MFHKHLVILLKVHVVLLKHIAARSYRLCLCSYYKFNGSKSEISLRNNQNYALFDLIPPILKPLILQCRQTYSFFAFERGDFNFPFPSSVNNFNITFIAQLKQTTRHV